ncbi:uncharacterized protein LOC121693224 [Alosa sapidissima]|uniref:uncharacterized protein LOC121693224 n=1 Tax=Alosa sapidissima TaxID=34773 RepID=UPI001C093D95|nr:uncharacterized protein LOC121693224 [Alosa sapidissima]
MSASGNAKEPPDPLEMAFGGLGCDHGLLSMDKFETRSNDLEELSGEHDSESTISEGDEGEWNLIQRASKKRKGNTKLDKTKRVRTEVKVVIRFQTPCVLNPLKVSEAIYKQIGEVRSVRTLRDGNLLVVCQDSDQRMGLMKLKTLLGKSVKSQDWEERGKIMAVISGVSTDLSEEDIKSNVKRVRVSKVKRLQVLRNGSKGPSLSVLLVLDEVKMPERIMIGQQGISIQFVWVPAHKGVGGNEEADKLAKEATKEEEVQLNIPLSRSEVKVIIKHKVNLIWQAEWDKEKKGRHLYNIQKNILNNKPMYPNRQEEVWFTRMRIGHTGLNNSLHVVNKHPTGKCEFCGMREDVDHVLLKCLRFSRQREKLKREVNTAKKAFSLDTLLGEPRSGNITSAVITFIKETQLANRI